VGCQKYNEVRISGKAEAFRMVNIDVQIIVEVITLINFSNQVISLINYLNLKLVLMFLLKTMYAKQKHSPSSVVLSNDILMLDLASDTDYSLIMTLTVEKNVVGGLFFKILLHENNGIENSIADSCFSKM